MNKYLFRTLSWLLFVPFVAACVSETDFQPTGEGGRLCLSFDNIVTAVTRTTPAGLGKPLAADFHISVVNESGRALYDGPFRTGESDTKMSLTVPVGEYTVTAEYGDNRLMGYDTPYYTGTSKAKVSKDETAAAKIDCKVGNALVSANFGKDEEEKKRFDRYFSDYELCLSIGEHTLGIKNNAPWLSIYVRAGSHVTLSFRGKLTDGTPFSQLLPNETTDGENIFPDVLNAGDHAIVTLTMPAPENDLTVNISKVEMEELTLDETIPLSWLPKPRVTATHRYDEKSELAGTDLTFNNAYPGLTWRAVITNAEDETVRDLTDTGALTSAYTSSAEWPYLPEGEYKAVYYIVSDDGQGGTKETKINEDTFSVPAPELALTLGGYTAHTKWEEGDVDAANACERLTVYEPSVYANISEALRNHPRYNYSFVCTYDGETKASEKSNVYREESEKLENQAVQANPHVLRGQVIFANMVLEEQLNLRITGLPVDFNPPTEGTGWARTQGTVNFNGDHVRLGNWSWSNPHAMRNNTWVNIPVGTRLCMDYRIGVSHGTVKTTVTVTAGGQELLKSQDEELLDGESLRTSQTITASSNITQLDCEGSWGSASTHSLIYRLYFKYAR